jgi:tRNA (guanine37-N1)-methyltransferase
MRFDIITLFPEMFPGYLDQSLLSKAIKNGIVEVHLHDLRKWSRDKHQCVDDRPFGGGPGMVLKVEPVIESVEEVQQQGEPPGQVILLTPTGRRLDQPLVEKLADHQRLILLCGRYEGFDQRVTDILNPLEISVGDFVLNGGEVASMIVVDTVIRLIPGVLGDEQSSVDDSFSNAERSLEHAQYTRPREYRGHRVPEVLLSGDHQAIARWRKEQREEKTRRRQDQNQDNWE